MKNSQIRLCAFCVICFFLAGNSLSAQVPNETAIIQLIPNGRTRVDIMTFEMSHRSIYLLNKFQKAAQEDPEWWFSYIKKGKEGESLSYHPKLGLTKEEFNELQKRETEKKLKKAGEAILTVKSHDGNTYYFNGDNSIAEIAGIEIDVKKNVVRTPFGTTTTHSRIIANADGKQLPSPWNGIQWKLEEGNIDGELKDITVVQVKFALGKLVGSDRGILIYNASRVELGVMVERVMFILCYDMK